MDELQIRLQAALTEQKAISDTLSQRCVNLAAEIAVLRAQLAALEPKPEKK